jgi:hypothetical protein
LFCKREKKTFSKLKAADLNKEADYTDTSPSVRILWSGSDKHPAVKKTFSAWPL